MTTRARWMMASVCVAAIGAARPVAQQTPSFATTAVGVSVPVSVKDRNAPVAGLTSADFAVTDNGVPQHPTSELVDTVSCDLTLVLDVSASMAKTAEDYKDEVRQIARMLRSTDRLRVLTFDGDVHQVLPFWPPAGTLPLDRLRLSPFPFSPGSASDVFDGILFALPHAPSVSRQHLIVVFTDGGANISSLEVQAVADAVGRSDGLLEIALVAPEDEAEASTAGRHSMVRLLRSIQPATGWIPVLRSMAASTGGEVRNTEGVSLPKAFGDLLTDIRRSYVLRYTAVGVKTQGWHTLVVAVPAHPEYTVRARLGYQGE
jgi:VWFA-related protein